MWEKVGKHVFSTSSMVEFRRDLKLKMDLNSDNGLEHAKEIEVHYLEIKLRN